MNALGALPTDHQEEIRRQLRRTGRVGTFPYFS
jgi:hypothetical protein